MRVTVRVVGARPCVLGVGETLVFGRAPTEVLTDAHLTAGLNVTILELARCGSNVSRHLGDLVVRDGVAQVRWRGRPVAQLSSLFDAPGGARRVTLNEGMMANLDAGENQLVVLRGREEPAGYGDLAITIDVESSTKESPYHLDADEVVDWRRVGTDSLPGIEAGTDIYYVALALAQPWLSGADDYPRPPTNREISEQVRDWRGDAGRLAAPQRVHDAIQHIAVLAFGAKGYPYPPADGRRVENIRYAVGRRAAEVGLVTADQLEQVEREARLRHRPGQRQNS